MGDAEVQLLDIRNVVSGNARTGAPLPPEEDVLRVLRDMVNASELDEDQMHDDDEAPSSGGEGDDASVASQEP